jgi:hypothetical protein
MANPLSIAETHKVKGPGFPYKGRKVKLKVKIRNKIFFLEQKLLFIYEIYMYICIYKYVHVWMSVYTCVYISLYAIDASLWIEKSIWIDLSEVYGENSLSMKN